MGIFSFFFGRRTPKPLNKQRKKPTRRLLLEALEDRALPTCYTVSGYVFNDVNNDGLYQKGSEQPLANVTVELVNSNNQVINTATTDSTGFYQFQKDQTISQTPQTVTQTLTYPSTATDFNLSQALNQFDPSQGTLQSITITNNGSITSTIKVENTSPSSATITATVSGNMTLTGPGVNSVLNLSQNAGSFNASAYDNSLDFAGTSGFSFAPNTANGTDTVTLTGSALTPFIGTGTVNLNEAAEATSSAHGSGNLDALLASSGSASVTVVYNYIPGNCIKPGNYTIVLPNQPAGYFPGKESSNNVVLPVPPGTDSIPVTLTNSNLTDNDFGELTAAKVSGYVYVDTNNDGIKEGGELGLPGIAVNLTGTDDLGNPVNLSGSTDPNGFYQFNTLRPGTYTVSDVPPSTYLAGKITPGMAGEVAGNANISNIVLGSGAQSNNNNFGYLSSTSVSGFVYVDPNNDGIKEAGEPGLPGVAVTLTGTDDLGHAVSLSGATDPTGFYQFNNLRPGTYTVSDVPPANYLVGKITPGMAGEVAGNANISNIVLTSGVASNNNNFAYVNLGSLSGFVYQDLAKDGKMDAGDPGIGQVQVTLTGTNDQGPVSLNATTDNTGFYQFNNLRPGTYTITETPPANYLDGAINVGALGGTPGTHNVSVISVGMGQNGPNYDFGEILKQNADLAIVKTANLQQVTVGGTLVYTLTVSNLGPDTAQNVVVTDTLPTGVTFVSASSPGWALTDTNGVVTGTIGSLAMGVTDNITVTIMAPSTTGNITNTVTVTSNTPDPNPNNNTSTVTTPVIDNPPQSIPKNIVPLSTTPAIVTKIQLIDFYNGTNYTDPVQIHNEAVVDGIYQTMVGQHATAQQQLNWAQAFENGTPTSALVNTLMATTQYRDLEATNLYQEILHRNPTSSELTSAATSLANGAAPQSLMLTLLTSSEYQAAHPTTDAFVLGFYQDVLSEIPGSATELNLVQSLGTGTPTTTAQSLLNSTPTYNAIVTNDFIAVLRRLPTATELQYWTNQMQNDGLTNDQLVQQLLTSGEFYNLAVDSIV